MAYDSMINRTGAADLIPVQVSREIIQEVPTQSVFLRLANRMPNMTSKQTKMPVMATAPTAYFVNGDTGLKQTTNMTWDNVYITAEELAVIVPIPEAVLDDSDYDIWGEVRPRITEALGKAIDAAVFFGTNKPDSWPTAIVPAAIAAANYGTITTAGLYQNINGEGGVIAKLEEQGMNASAFVGALALRAKLRGAVDANGQPIFRSAYSNGAAGSMVYELNGTAIEFPDNGAWDASQALLLAGDFRYARYAIRQDITYKVLDQAVISDGSGNVILNLAQQDCVALRVVMRLGWALPKPVHPISGRNYYPFSVLMPSDVITIESAKYNVTAPVKSATPQSSHDSGTGYTAEIAWSPAAASFAASTAYTATVTLTAADGYAFSNDFSEADIVGLPATTGDSHPAQSVKVTNEGETVTIKVKYVATGA